MKINPKIALLFLLIVVVFIGFSHQKQVVIIQPNQTPNLEDKVIKDFSKDWVNTLEGLTYSYSISPEKKIISLVFNRKDEWFYREYQVINGETITLDPDLGQLYYVSLPANRTIAYSWSMFDSLKAKTSKAVTYDEWIRIPFDNPQSVEGENYDRQVFKLAEGEPHALLRFQYRHQSEDRDDVFECSVQLSL